jgi:hypothetical protein
MSSRVSDDGSDSLLARHFQVEIRNDSVSLKERSLHQPGTERSASVPRAANNRGKVTNNPRRFSVSGRTALGRRIRDLADTYAHALGGWPALSGMMALNVKKASELVALAEKARSDALRDGNVDPLHLARLDGCANRAVRALQLDVPRGDSVGSTLANYLDGGGDD